MFDIRKEPINILAIILVLTKWKLNIETHTRTHRNIHVYKQRSKQASTTKDIQSGNKIIYLCSFLNRNLNFILQLFGTEEKLKSWKWIKHQLHRKNNMQFHYRHIIHALTQYWKETIKQFALNLYPISFFNEV